MRCLPLGGFHSSHLEWRPFSFCLNQSLFLLLLIIYILMAETLSTSSYHKDIKEGASGGAI
jgi:hypothetical protein